MSGRSLRGAVAVVGVGSTQDEIERRPRRTIQLEDPVRLVGPYEPASVRFPPEAAGGAEPLRLRQVGLGMPKLRIEVRVLARDGDKDALPFEFAAA